MSATIELQPCPFCGMAAQEELAIFRRDSTICGRPYTTYNAACSCGAMGPDADTPEQARERWNRRGLDSVKRNCECYATRHEAFAAFEALRPRPIWDAHDGIPTFLAVQFEEWLWLPVLPKGSKNRCPHEWQEKYLYGKDEEGEAHRV